MPSALVAGAFGQANPGDEALLEAVLGALPGWTAVATTRDPTATQLRHGCEAVNSADRLAVALAARQADLVVFAGGTVFKRLHPSTGRRPLGLLTAAAALSYGARLTGSPVALVGVGADRLVTRAARRLARGVVRRSHLTVLRDEESAAALAVAGVAPPFRVGADPAWAVVGDQPARSRADVVVVALSHLAGTDGEDHGAYLARALRPVAASGLDVHLQPWQVDESARDHALARLVAAELGGRAHIIEPPATLQDARAHLAGVRAVIGLRFHSLVAAAAAGTPFVAVTHEPKLSGLARRFRQPTVTTGAGLARLGAAMDDALSGPRPSSAVVRAQVAGAEEGFRLLRLVATAGRGEELDTITGLPLVPDPWQL